MKPKVLILRTAGTNCDKETAHAYELAGAAATVEHIHHLKKHKQLNKFNILCLPGGFSYGDDLGAGKIFSLEFLLWLKSELENFIDNGGLILGICNGFQVLVKTGILPDLNFNQTVTLTDNDSHRFEDRWVYLKTPEKDQNIPANKIWLKNLDSVIMLPVAHAEGKFFAEGSVIDKLEKNKQVALRYVNDQGVCAGYPFNPNGSINDIAGITDISGRVFGLMPHPERFIDRHHFPFWQNRSVTAWGFIIIENSVKFFEKGG